MTRGGARQARAKHRHLPLAAVLALALAVPAAAAGLPGVPGVGLGDRRLPVDQNAMPWRALGRVQTELGERCTGFAIAPAVVVTAAHCLWLPQVRRFLQPSSVHVLMGYRAGAWRAHAQARSFVVTRGYDARQESRTMSHDVAVLVLDRPVVPPSALLAPASAVPPAGQAVLLGGYGQDRDELIVAAPGCRILDGVRDGTGGVLLRHDCPATRGTSGAPLLIRDGDGRWAVLGVQVAAMAAGSGGLAAPLPVQAPPASR